MIKKAPKCDVSPTNLRTRLHSQHSVKFIRDRKIHGRNDFAVLVPAGAEILIARLKFHRNVPEFLIN